MAKINKIKKNGTTIYPLTIPQAVIDPTTGTPISTTLNGKQDQLVSGTNIKTINGSSLLAGGDITISNGKSAYQIWLDNGNVGTEADYLASLKGDSGYSGAAGELQIVNALNSTDTTAGLSAYQGNVLNSKIYSAAMNRAASGRTTAVVSNAGIHTYSIEGLTLYAGHKYVVRCSADGSITGAQVTVKITDSSSSTLKSVNLAVNSTWDGTEVTMEYTPSSTLYGCKVGHYLSKITAGASIDVVISDTYEQELAKQLVDVAGIGPGENTLARLIDSGIVVIEKGSLSSAGSNTVNDSRVRTRGAITPPQRLSVPDGLRIYSVCYYSAWTGYQNYTFVKSVTVNSNHYTFEDYPYVRIAFSRSDYTNITPAQFLTLANPPSVAVSRAHPVIYWDGEIVPDTKTFYTFGPFTFIEGHSYRFTVVTDGSPSTLTIRDDTNTTIQTISSSVGTGTKVFDIVAGSTMVNAWMVAYYADAALGHTFHYTVEDIDVMGKGDQADDIPSYYSDMLAKDQENLNRWSDFKAFFFTDVHAGQENVSRIITLANSLGSSKVDCILNGGDTVLNLIGEGLSWYDSLVDNSTVPVLATPGNHDCWTSSWAWDTSVNVYDLVIAKVASSTSIVQPDNAASNGLCYYYKDFGDVRVISILAMAMNSSNRYWDNVQASWFESVLTDAKTNGKAVIVLTHAPFKKANAIRIDTKHWNSWLDYRTGNPDKSLTFDEIHTAEDAVAKVDAFIQSGGKFICWLTGHTHVDSILYHSQYTGQFMFNANSARYDRKPDGITATSTKDFYYDSFNYIGVDLRSNQLKVVRFGWNEDSSLRHRETLCYDYSTHEILSEK